MITCVVGSGGKTTLIRKLAKAYKSEGKSVLITTTTHMTVENDTCITDDADQIIELLHQNGYAFVGKECDEANKIKALSHDTLKQVIPYADEVLIEADGSRQFPLKMPNSNEPVLVDECDRIIVVTSLLALGKPAQDVIHRFKNVQMQLSSTTDTIITTDTSITAATTITAGTTITAEHIQTLLRKGYIEPFMTKNKNYEIQITNDGSLYQRALASLLKANVDVSILNPDWFAPKPRLFICGAGHVAKELADIASYLDFRIHVMDKRSEFANKERFPQAEEVYCESFDNLSNHLEDGSYYVVVTPGHQDDYLCVKNLLSSSYTYLGMIGSRKKIAATYDKLKADGFSEDQLETIHAPIGLSIGAVTPAEIAISILAQIIEIKNKKSSASICTELLNTNESGTLCIIIEKTGSAPRGVGSMMLVTDNGQIDTLGGGAVENQILIDAKDITEPCIKEYNLGPSDTAKLGMICGGTNKVLFIPV